MFALDEWRGLDQVFPRRRPVRHADLGPDALQVVAGVGHVAVAEPEPLAGDRVVGAALAEIEDRSVLALGLRDDVGHVEHLRLERSRGREELEQVVPLLRGDLGVGARAQVRERDVIDRDVDALRGPPVLGVLVEPDVVRGNEVAPLQDLDRLLAAPDPDRGTERRGGDGRPGRRDELAPIDAGTLGHLKGLQWLSGEALSGVALSDEALSGDALNAVPGNAVPDNAVPNNAPPGPSHNVYSALSAY